MSKIINVNCPNCKKIVTWEKISIFRPFCSKHCQSIDLGEWVTEKKRIPIINLFYTEVD